MGIYSWEVIEEIEELGWEEAGLVSYNSMFG